MFSDLKKEFLQDLAINGRSPTTIFTYETMLKGFETFLENKALTAEDVTPAHLREYLVSLWEGKLLSVGTICVKVRAVKRYFEYLLRSGRLLSNPSKELKEPKRDRRSPRQTLTPERVRSMLEQVNTNTPIGIRNMAILETLASCGIRHRELMLLRGEDIDLKSSMLVVREGKGGKPRVIPLTPQAVFWLKAYLDRARPALSKSQSVTPEQRLSDGLWMNKDGKPLKRQMLRVIVRSYAEKAGLPHRVQVHDFRRFLLTELVKNGMPLPMVSEVAGHSSTETLRQYCATSGFDLKEVMKSHPRETDARKDDDDEEEPMAPVRMR